MDKSLNFKIISVTIAYTLFFTSAGYGVEVSKNTTLRVPVGGSISRIEDGIDRSSKPTPDEIVTDAKKKAREVIDICFDQRIQGIQEFLPVPNDAYIELEGSIGKGTPEEWLQRCLVSGYSELLVSLKNCKTISKRNKVWVDWIKKMIKDAENGRSIVNTMLLEHDLLDPDNTWSDRLNGTVRCFEQIPGMTEILSKSAKGEYKFFDVSTGLLPDPTFDWAGDWKEKFPNVLILGSDFSIGYPEKKVDKYGYPIDDREDKPREVMEKTKYSMYWVKLKKTPGIIAFDPKGKVIAKAFSKEVEDKEIPSNKALEKLYTEVIWEKELLEYEWKKADEYGNIWVLHPLGQNGYGKRLKLLLDPENKFPNLELLDCPVDGRVTMPDGSEFKALGVRCMNNWKRVGEEDTKEEEDRQEVQLAIDYLGTVYIREEGYLIEGFGGRLKRGKTVATTFNLHKKEQGEMVPQEIYFSIFQNRNRKEPEWVFSHLKGRIRNPDFKKAHREEKRLDRLIGTILRDIDKDPELYWHAGDRIAYELATRLREKGYDAEMKDFEEDGTFVTIKRSSQATSAEEKPVTPTGVGGVVNPAQHREIEAGI